MIKSVGKDMEINSETKPMVNSLEKRVNYKRYKFLMIFTELGSTLGSIVLFCILFFFSGFDMLPLVFIYLTQLGVVEAIKFFLRAPRPNGANGDKNIFGYKISSSSFPSGHTANIFTMAFLITNFYSLSLIPTSFLYLLATLVALSRLYLGRHYFVDIVGGIITSITICIITWDILARAGFL